MNNYSQKLVEILKASGFTQEVLAKRFGVSFVTLNSWVNKKKVPRSGSLQKINELYDEIIGAEQIGKDELARIKKLAVSKKFSITKLVSNRGLLDKITVNLTYHTNTIEGSTMTRKDVEAVILDNKVIRNRTAIEQREAINHQAALNFLLDELQERRNKFKITEHLVRETHLRLMNGIISDAGMFRNHAVRIMGGKVPLANYLKIPELLGKWCTEMNRPHSDSIRLLAETHSKFEQIHPFSDGNGRVGRLFLFIKALQLGIVPPIVQKEKKQAYYKYLEISQLEGQSELLEKFIADAVLDLATEIKGV